MSDYTRLKGIMQRLLALLVLLASVAISRQPSFEEFRTIQDSLIQVPPRFREDWLRDRGLEDPFVFGTVNPESTGLRLVGKYGRGPSREVTGQDSLLFLSDGSEVAVFSLADPGNPVLLSEIQARSGVGQTLVSGSVRACPLFS